MKHQGLCFGLGLLAFQGLHAGTMGELSTDFKGPQKVATITVGPDFVYQGGSQTLTLIPPFQNTYASNKQWKAVGDFGGFLGLEYRLQNGMHVQTGIAGYGNTSIPISGDVWQFGLPAFNNFSYQYHINHGRVMLSNKLLTTWSRYPGLQPYLSVELGAAFNRASGYSETATTALAVPMASFSSHSQASFSWGLGVGGDYALGEHFRAGIGYQFADLGSASLGVTPSAQTEQTLSLSNLWSNQLRFQLSYVA